MTLVERARAASATPSVGRGRRTLADELRLALADDIVRGLIAPGAGLDETELARRFGVSRTPVREAIRQLAASGLARCAPIAARWWRGRARSACSACSRRWPSSKPCALASPPSE